MIILLTGDNSYEIQQELSRITQLAKNSVETFDGLDITTTQLPDIFMGTTLFSRHRCIVIKNLSENKTVWNDLSKWLERTSPDTDIIFIDAKPDKRTATYKLLKDQATIVETHLWTYRDVAQVRAWVGEHATAQGVQLSPQLISTIIGCVGFDQWQLHQAIEKLALVDEVTDAVIASVIDAHPEQNVFDLFDAALSGNRAKVVTMIRDLQLSEDPYRLFGLLAGQAFQIAAVMSAGPQDSPAKDFGIHPYAVSKLQSVAKRQGRSGVRKIIAAFAKADDDLKQSRGEPWLLIERTLVTIG